MTPKLESLLARVEAYLTQYVTFSNPDYPFVASLWAMGTYAHQAFNAFPYLVITSTTKRSGKTLFAEVLSHVVAMPEFGTASPAAIYRMIRDEHPTIFLDEAEFMAGATAKRRRADVFSTVMNMGYRKGQEIARAGKNGVEKWPAYCPKAFVLIGDVYDTLRDRSIIIRMQRGESRAWYSFDQAKGEGNALGEEIRDALEADALAVQGHYSGQRLAFLRNREEEIWTPLFALCRTFAPARVEVLTRIAADLATEKTADAQRYVNLLGEEQAAEDDEYGRRLLADVAALFDGKRYLGTANLIERLHALPTGPWRKFRGTGITATDLAHLLARFGVRPSYIKLYAHRGRGAKKTEQTVRGYRHKEVTAALATIGGEQGLRRPSR